MRRRAPRPAAAAIGVARDAVRPQTGLAAVQGVWADAVGAAVARVCTPVSARGETVVVECESSVWAQELDLMQAQFVERLRELLGPGIAPEQLRFEVRRGD